MAKKILLVDDDEMMRIFFRDIFWIHGGGKNAYEVESLSSVSEAREALADPSKKPNVVFLDLSMPVKKDDGTVAMQTEPSVELVKDIKSGKFGPAIPVIVFSGFSDPPIKQKLKDAGADQYLVKGEYMPRELIDFVDGIKI